KISQEESSRLPSQQIAFSGIQLDSRLMVATPSQQRVKKHPQAHQSFQERQGSGPQIISKTAGDAHSGLIGGPLGLLSFAASSNSAERSWLAPHLSQAQAGQSHFQLPCKATPVEKRDISPRGSPWGPY